MTDESTGNSCIDAAICHVLLCATPFCWSPLWIVVVVLNGAALRLLAWQHLSVIHACKSLEWVPLSKLRQYAAEHEVSNTWREVRCHKGVPCMLFWWFTSKFTCSTKALKSGNIVLACQCKGIHNCMSHDVYRSISHTHTQSRTRSPTSLPIPCRQTRYIQLL